MVASREVQNVPAVRFTFRILNTETLPFFVEVRNQSAAFLHDAREFNLKQAESWFSEGPESTYWIAYADEQPAGYFRVLEINSGLLQIGADLHEEFRGKRLSKEMYIQFFKRVILALGHQVYCLRVLRNNTRAQRLYISLGFEEISVTERDIYMELKRSDLLSALNSSIRN